MAITDTLIKELEANEDKDCIAFPMHFEDTSRLFIGDEYREITEKYYRCAWDNEEENFYIFYNSEWLEAQSFDFDFINMPDVIKSIEDVQNFFQILVTSYGLTLHPDDPFSEYINLETKEPFFTQKQAILFDRLMNESFMICNKEGYDIYLLAGEALNPTKVIPETWVPDANDGDILEERIRSLKDIISYSETLALFAYRTSLNEAFQDIKLIGQAAVHHVLIDHAIKFEVANANWNPENDSEEWQDMLVEYWDQNIKPELFPLSDDTDLFDHPEYLPKEVQALLTEFGEDESYDKCEELLNLLKPHGYTFEYYLDAEPFNLKKIVDQN